MLSEKEEAAVHKNIPGGMMYEFCDTNCDTPTFCQTGYFLIRLVTLGNTICVTWKAVRFEVDS